MVATIASMNSDAEAQEAELQSIEAIFPDIFNLVEVNKVSLRFGDKIRLDVVLPRDYPSQSPPKFTLSCPSLSSNQRFKLSNQLNDAYLQNIGEPIMYAWIEVLQNFLREEESGEESGNSSDEAGESSFQAVDEGISNSPSCPQIITGDIFTDRKSVFQAHIARIKSKDEVNQVLSTLKSNNKIARATHNIYAYRLRLQKDGAYFQVEDCEDDGEHGASAKMLSILHHMKANSLIVVVSRWYGGVHLGPDRFRIINNLTREIVSSHPEMWEEAQI